MRLRSIKIGRIISSIGSNNLKLLILQEGRSGLHQIEIRGRRAIKLLLAAVLLTPLLLYLGAHLLLETAHAHRVAKLRRDNAALHQLVDDFEQRIGTLEREIGVLSNMDEDLRVHANLPSIPDEIRQLGIGGSMAGVSTDMDYLMPTSDRGLAAITTKLDVLARELKLEQISYEQLRDTIKDDLARLLQTPSIAPIKGGHYSSRFGARRHPYTRKREFHHGLDITADTGTKVHATAGGKVLTTRFDPTLGLYIKIDHGNGFKTLYGHLRTFEVEPGQVVKRGDLIGRSGNTGRSTAPHLHYEVRHYNRPQNPANYF